MKNMRRSLTKNIFYELSATSLYSLQQVYITITGGRKLLIEIFLLYEYRDLFIDMAVRNNRSELAIANRHQER